MSTSKTGTSDSPKPPSQERSRLAKEIMDDATRWLENPDEVYPFYDLRIMSDTIFFGAKTDPQETTESLMRIDRIVKILRDEGKEGSARLIEEKVDSIKKKLAEPDHLEASGYKRERCLVSLKQAVRELIVALSETQSENRLERVPDLIDTSHRANRKRGSLAKLRLIDENVTRSGIPGNKNTLKRLKEFLSRRMKRPDWAKLLYYDQEQGIVNVKAPHRSMFEQK